MPSASQNLKWTGCSKHQQRSASSTPQWQRKLEAPLRVLLACVSSHPDYEGQKLIILWKTFTLVTQDMFKVMQSQATTAPSEESLWSEKWNQLLWGSQWEFDEAERQAFRAAKAAAQGSNKGASLGKGKKHWSNLLLHNSWHAPYPYQLDIIPVEAVAFAWDEYSRISNQTVWEQARRPQL